jgi:hypothetical protein
MGNPPQKSIPNEVPVGRHGTYFSLPHTISDFPNEQLVGRLKLCPMGIVIDELSPEQKKYLAR